VAIDNHFNTAHVAKVAVRRDPYTEAQVDGFLILVVGGLVAFGLWTWLAHRGKPRAVGPHRGSGLLGLRSAREITEDRAELEAEDLAQLLEAHNTHRRRRGEPERSVEDIEMIVSGDIHEQRRRREGG
jgi:hypothetical protein